jgi:hypothetical protein
MTTLPLFFLDKKPWGGPLSQLILWSAVGLLCGLGSLATFWVTGYGVFLTTGAVLGLGMVLVPVGIKAGYLIMIQLGHQVGAFLHRGDANPEEFFLAVLHARLGRRRPLGLVAAAVGSVSLVAFARAGVFEFGPMDEGFRPGLSVQIGVTVWLAGFFAGAALYLVFVVGSVIWSLGRFAVVPATHKFGAISVGDSLLRIYGLGGAIWFVFSCSALVGLRDTIAPLVILAGGAMVFFLVSFPICLVPLHRRMLEIKRARVLDCAGRLESLAQRRIEDRDEAYLQVVGEARREYAEAQELPEWPFDRRALAWLLTSGVFSNLPPVAGLALQHWLA